MDRTDEAILACLRRNARMSASRIGKEVNLSVSSVLERIHRMEEQGIILRYAAVVDPSKLGKPLTLLMGVTMEHPRYHEGFKKAMAQEPDVTRCEYLTGELDFILRVSVASHAQLRELHQRISAMPGVANLTSYYVLETVKEE